MFNSLIKKVNSRNICFFGAVIQDGSAIDLVLALFDLGSKVNTIHPVFIERLGLVIQTINVGAQKIHSTISETYRMVVAAFLVTDQASRVKFFEKTFPIANVSLDVVFGMLFFILNGADVNFPKKEL